MPKRHFSIEESETEIVKLDAMHGQPFALLAAVCALLFRNVYARLDELDEIHRKEHPLRKDSAMGRQSSARVPLKQGDD